MLPLLGRFAVTLKSLDSLSVGFVEPRSQLTPSVIGLFDCRSPDFSSVSIFLIPNFKEEFLVFRSLIVDTPASRFSDSDDACFKVVRKIGILPLATGNCCAPIFYYNASVAGVSSCNSGSILYNSLSICSAGRSHLVSMLASTRNRDFSRCSPVAE